MRRTVRVEEIVGWANTQLSREDEHADIGFKAGVCTMVEKIMKAAECYDGYSYKYPEKESKVHTDEYYSRTYSLRKLKRNTIVSNKDPNGRTRYGRVK